MVSGTTIAFPVVQAPAGESRSQLPENIRSAARGLLMRRFKTAGSDPKPCRAASAGEETPAENRS
ncbi:hypothetical protein DIPPA_03700 [Diplonema papillatum]|nr:hypothetical protein DIPPA_03700 [Diplonema papillatum]